MSTYRRYFLSLAIMSTLVVVIMALMGQNDIGAYYTVLVLVSLVITLLFAYISPAARRGLRSITAVFFAGFLVIVALKVIDVLAGRS